MSLHVKSFEFNMFGELTYIIWDEASHEAAVVDAGMTTQSERATIDSFISENNLSLKYLINTHVHLDHTFGVPYMKERYNLELWASPMDIPLADRIEQQAIMFHLPFKASNVVIDRELHEGDIIKLGESPIEIIEVPGHTPGGLALYAPLDNFVLTGDSLFHSSIGRTDLPGGNHSQLINAVTSKLMSLPSSTRVYPGHGPSTTIGHEQIYNPYLS
ncbi:MAG: MBL fold metallo-hydrolase [Clostridiales bacterium]|nr:MBL fold metallo-hydrolase [Clostridiales bacterium]